MANLDFDLIGATLAKLLKSKDPGAVREELKRLPGVQGGEAPPAAAGRMSQDEEEADVREVRTLLSGKGPSAPVQALMDLQEARVRTYYASTRLEDEMKRMIDSVLPVEIIVVIVMKKFHELYGVQVSEMTKELAAAEALEEAAREGSTYREAVALVGVTGGDAQSAWLSVQKRYRLESAAWYRSELERRQNALREFDKVMTSK
jgi:hypothetical protein